MCWVVVVFGVGVGIGLVFIDLFKFFCGLFGVSLLFILLLLFVVVFDV